MIGFKLFQISLSWVYTAFNSLSDKSLVFREDLSLYGQEVKCQKLLEYSNEVLNYVFVFR
jgi:hypothetical protein